MMTQSGEVLFPEIITPLNPVNLPIQRSLCTQAKARQRICIFKLGALGDLIMATPLLASLRRHFPDAHITWIVEHSNRAAIEAHPLIDAIILWNGGYMSRGRKKPGRVPRNLLDLFSFYCLMRSRRFDVFLHMQAEEWSFVTTAANARMSIGLFDPKIAPDRIPNRLKRKYDFTYMQGNLPVHRTDQYCLPLLALGLTLPTDKQTSFGFTADDRDKMDAFLRQAGIGAHETLIIIAPITTWPSRCWPPERFAILVNALMAAGHRVVLIGTPKEADIIQEIADRSQTRPITTTGDLTFRQIGALISRSNLLISSDTGPMHVAGAVKTPFVALFGPTPVEGRIPFASRGISLMHPVPCGPCDLPQCPNQGDDYMRCMRLIGVEEVLDAAKTLLASQGR